MRIAICGSLDFTNEMKGLADDLEKCGLEVEIPISSRRILNGEFSLEEVRGERGRGIKSDAIRAYYKVVTEADAILVANYDKNSTKNYIGGNTFLEMGFAYVLGKKIYLLNDIPDMMYTDEIEAMQPIVLRGDVRKINETNEK